MARICLLNEFACTAYATTPATAATSAKTSPMNTARLPPMPCPLEYSRFSSSTSKPSSEASSAAWVALEGIALNTPVSLSAAGRRESRVLRRTGIGIALSASG